MARYVKTQWNTTTVFNPTNMNHIEQGIENTNTIMGGSISSLTDLNNLEVDTNKLTWVSGGQSDIPFSVLGGQNALIKTYGDSSTKMQEFISARGTARRLYSSNAWGSWVSDAWEGLGTLYTGQTGINIADYNEISIIPLVNGAIRYNSFYFPTKDALTSTHYINILQDNTYNWNGTLSVTNNVLSFTTNTLNGWNSMALAVFGRK